MSGAVGLISIAGEMFGIGAGHASMMPGQGRGVDRQEPLSNYEVTLAESSPETSKVRIGREKPDNESSPTSRLTT